MRFCVIRLAVRSASIMMFLLFAGAAAPAAAGQLPQSAARLLTSGEAIYQAGCAGCHGATGAGAPPTSTGFDRPGTFPDFTDCAGTTPELDVDWRATITEGGHGRGFSPIMPTFSDELTPEQVGAVIEYLRTLCRDTHWPRGELNLPRPLRTEKAFPEDETVYTMAVSAHHAPDLDTELTYEHSFGARNQLEFAAPFSSLHDDTGARVAGVGDVALGWKRVFYAGRDAILSGQGELAFPSGNSDKGLGSGVLTVGAFASYGQILPANTFVQAQVGTDQPTSTDQAPRTVFWRVAAGESFRQDQGLGRLWSPMFEVVSDRELTEGAAANIDVIPQFQVTLNRRQHIRVNVGLQTPVTNTRGRSKEVVFYFLWDWFDGGLFEGWK
jgi:mono/diheme cytochrome c family protein